MQDDADELTQPDTPALSPGWARSSLAEGTSGADDEDEQWVIHHAFPADPMETHSVVEAQALARVRRNNQPGREFDRRTCGNVDFPAARTWTEPIRGRARDNTGSYGNR